MKRTVDNFPKLISERLKALDFNVFSAEKRSGLPEDAIRNIIRSKKKSGPTLSRVQEVCDALGLELYIGPPRTEADLAADIIKNHGEAAEVKKILNMGNVALRQIVEDSKAAEKEAAQQAIAATSEFWKDQDAAIRKHYTFVNLHEIQASAGAGRINGQEDQPSSIAFSNTWLKKIGINPDAASLIYVAGDSMEPTLKDGSIVLIDHQKREPVGKHVYAIRNGDELMVKRLEKPDGKTLLLTSDNPKYATKVLTGFDLDAVGIVGKVVWSAFTLDD